MSSTQQIGTHIKAVFFDHDDTLVGTMDAKWAHHKYTAKRYYRKELSDDEIKLHWGKPLHELVCLLYGTDNAKQALSFNYAHHEDFPKVLFKETIAVLRHIRASGRLTGIVTATSRFSFEHDLQLHGIPQKLVNYTQTADDTPYHKPDPRVFETAIAWLAKHQIKPHEVLYIGDGLHDMKAALGAGFEFLGIETGLVTGRQFTLAKAASIASIGDLLP